MRVWPMLQADEGPGRCVLNHPGAATSPIKVTAGHPSTGSPDFQRPLHAGLEPRRLEQGLSALARQNAELSGRMRALAESMATVHSEMKSRLAALRS